MVKLDVLCRCGCPLQFFDGSLTHYLLFCSTCQKVYWKGWQGLIGRLFGVKWYYLFAGGWWLFKHKWKEEKWQKNQKQI